MLRLPVASAAVSTPSGREISLFVHIDCDDLWLYRAEYGLTDSGSVSVYDQALPRLLDVLEAAGARATLFVVARDLEDGPHAGTARSVLMGALDRGHAVANHSYEHSASFADLSANVRRVDVSRAHEVITAALGVPLLGFRGPGYFFDADLRDQLAALGYRYDGSRYPGWAPAAMRFAMRRKGSAKDVGATPKGAFEGLPTWDGSAAPAAGFLSVPIMTATALRLPTHTTAQHAFGTAYAGVVRSLVARGQARGAFLLHALDGVDTAEAPDLGMLPTLQRPLSWRLDLVRDVLRAAGSVRTAEELLAAGGGGG